MSSETTAKNLLPPFEFGDALSAAEAVAAYLGEAAVRTDKGVYWPAKTDTDAGDFGMNYSFYYGTSGIIFYLTELYIATGKRKYLDDAVSGAEYIIRTFDESTARFTPPNEDETFIGWPLKWTMQFGIPGIAFALTELGFTAENDEITAYARILTEKVAGAARETPSGVIWTGVNAILADGSTALFLLYAAERFGVDAWKALAIQAGEAMLTRAEVKERGLRLDGFGVNAPTEFPGFEVGTTGTAYVFAKLYEASGNKRFLDSASGGAEYIKSLAKSDSGGALVPYQIPQNEDVFFQGLCHGVAGHARLFYQLGKSGGGSSNWDFIETLLEGANISGAPENHSKGYWHVYSQCCGTASMLHFALGLWAETGQERFLNLAERCYRHILGFGTATDAGGLKWAQAFHRVKPQFVTFETGFSIGAAGIGSAFLELHLARTGQYRVTRLPDDPFPRTRKKN